MRAEEAKNGNRKSNTCPILPKAAPITMPPANQLQTAKAAPRSIFAQASAMGFADMHEDHHKDLHEDNEDPADNSPSNV